MVTLRDVYEDVKSVIPDQKYATHLNLMNEVEEIRKTFPGHGESGGIKSWKKATDKKTTAIIDAIFKVGRENRNDRAVDVMKEVLGLAPAGSARDLFMKHITPSEGEAGMPNDLLFEPDQTTRRANIRRYLEIRFDIGELGEGHG